MGWHEVVIGRSTHRPPMHLLAERSHQFIEELANTPGVEEFVRVVRIDVKNHTATQSKSLGMPDWKAITTHQFDTEGLELSTSCQNAEHVSKVFRRHEAGSVTGGLI